jgi:hypothetical protein
MSGFRSGRLVSKTSRLGALPSPDAMKYKRGKTRNNKKNPREQLLHEWSRRAHRSLKLELIAKKDFYATKRARLR